MIHAACYRSRGRQLGGSRNFSVCAPKSVAILAAIGVYSLMGISCTSQAIALLHQPSPHSQLTHSTDSDNLNAVHARLLGRPSSDARVVVVELWEQMNLNGAYETYSLDVKHGKPLRVEKGIRRRGLVGWLVAAAVIVVFLMGLFNGTRLPEGKPALLISDPQRVLYSPLRLAMGPLASSGLLEASCSPSIAPWLLLHGCCCTHRWSACTPPLCSPVSVHPHAFSWKQPLPWAAKSVHACVCMPAAQC